LDDVIEILLQLAALSVQQRPHDLAAKFVVIFDTPDSLPGLVYGEAS